MNPTILTIIIATAAFILSVFGSAWLNAQIMKSYIDAKFSGLDAKFDAITSEFKAVRAEIRALETRIDNLSSRVERIERQMDALFKPDLLKAGD